MRVLIADDSVLLREGLALILADDGHEVVAGVGDGEAMVAETLRLRPDLVIADIRMPRPTPTRACGPPPASAPSGRRPRSCC